jgi:hypothetical protein
MPRKVKFPPAVTDGRLIVVIDGEGERDDTILERRDDMPIGAWGEVPLPVPEDEPTGHA